MDISKYIKIRVWGRAIKKIKNGSCCDLLTFSDRNVIFFVNNIPKTSFNRIYRTFFYTFDTCEKIRDSFLHL